METCRDCLLEKWTEESVGSPDGPGFCECPTLKVEDYTEDEDE